MKGCVITKTISSEQCFIYCSHMHRLEVLRQAQEKDGDLGH